MTYHNETLNAYLTIKPSHQTNMILISTILNGLSLEDLLSDRPKELRNLLVATLVTGYSRVKIKLTNLGVL